MSGSDADVRPAFSKTVCELKHSGIDEKIDRIEELLEAVVKPSDGALATLKSDLERKVEKVDSKFNALVVFLISTGVGLVTALVPSIIKYIKYVLAP